MYGKLFASMYEGTLYGHWQAIVTFQQMIVLCDADGLVDMTPQAIAARTSIPLEIIQEGVKILEQPDPYSRTPGEEGKRIALLDEHRPWGWRIINYHVYRDLVVMEDKRRADRERIAAKRAAIRRVSLGVATSRNVSRMSQVVADVAHAEAEAEAEAEEKKKNRKRVKRAATETEFPEGFALDDPMRQQALKRFPDCDADEAFARFRDYHTSHGSRFRDWRRAWGTWVGNFESFGYPKKLAAAPGMERVRW